MQNSNDPLITPYVSAFLLTLGATAEFAAAAAPFIANTIGSLVVSGTLIGLQVLLTPRPQVPKPADGKIPIKQPIPPRIWGVGETRIAGATMFAGDNGALHWVTALQDGEIVAYLEYYFNDDKLTVTEVAGTRKVRVVQGSDQRYSGPFYDGVLHPLEITTAFGVAGVSMFPELSALFPTEVGDQFYGVGQSALYMYCPGVLQKDFQKVYPNGPPQPSVAVRTRRVFDPRDPEQDVDHEETWKFSQNLALCWLWYECFCPHGPGRNYFTAIFPVIDNWIEQADICDEAVAKRGGGTVPRYEIGHWWTGETTRESVRAMFVSACDGWMCPLPDGTLVIYVGRYVEPSTTPLTDDDIADYFFQSGLGKEDRVNELIVKYTSPVHDYGEVEAAPIFDEEQIATDGERLSSTVDLWQVQNTNQAKRLALREWNRQNETLRGTLVCRLTAMRYIGERWIKVESERVPRLSGLVIEVRKLVPDVVAGHVIIHWVRSGPHIDDYDPEDLVFGDGVDPPLRTKPGSFFPELENIDATAEGTVEGGIYIDVTLDDPGINVFAMDIGVRYRLDDAGGGVPGAWNQVSTVGLERDDYSDGDTITITIPSVLANEVYNIQVAPIGPGGTFGDWSEPAIDVDTGVVGVAPGTPVNFSTEVAGANIDMGWVNPNSNNMYVARVWRGAVFATATDISGALFGTANQTLQYTDVAPGTGTHTYWVTAENSAGMQSTPAGPEAETL